MRVQSRMSATSTRTRPAAARRSGGRPPSRGGAPRPEPRALATKAPATTNRQVTKARTALDVLIAHALTPRAESGAPVPDCFATVPEPRGSNGLRHRLAVVLTLCVAAVLCGETTVVGVGDWAAHAPVEPLAAVGARRDPREHDRLMAPSRDTVIRLLAALPAKVLARQVGAYLAGRSRRAPSAGPNRAGRRAATKAGQPTRPAIAVDGKTVRGAVDENGYAPHLLTAVPHDSGVMLGEHEIGAKTNEVSAFGPLLREVDGYHPLTGHVISADAPHTVKAHAELIVTELRAHFVFTVKGNTAALFDDCARAVPP